MCGIYGFSGGDKKVPNKYKIIMLGVLNQSRGKDSCGIYSDNHIRHGFKLDFNKDTSIFQDFASVRYFDFKRKNNIVIGHNRASTFGAKTLENAHPFLYWGDQEKQARFEEYMKKEVESYYTSGLRVIPDFILAMNGTLKDLTSYGVYTKYGEGEQYDFSKPHWSCDSKMLGDIIFHKGYDILKDYRGDAALVWSFPSKEKNTLYLWSGGSKTYSTGAIIRERPLHYFYCKNDEGIYYSSELGHLQVINQNSEKVHEVPMNTILKIVNGEITEKIEIPRHELINAVTPAPYTPPSYQNGNKKKYNTYESEYTDYEDTEDRYGRGVGKKSSTVLRLTKDIDMTEKKFSCIRFSGGGYKFFTMTSLQKGVIADGTYKLDTNGNISPDGTMYYFVDGYLCRNEEHSKALVKRRKDTGFYYDEDLNKHVHPQAMWKMANVWVGINMISECWYKPSIPGTLSYHSRGERISGDFKPMFSSKTFRFQGGEYLGDVASFNQKVTLADIARAYQKTYGYEFSTAVNNQQFTYDLYLISGYIYNFDLSIEENIQNTECMYEHPISDKAIQVYLDATENAHINKLSYCLFNNSNFNQELSIFSNLCNSFVYDFNCYFFEFSGKLFRSMSEINNWYVLNICGDNHEKGFYASLKNLDEVKKNISNPKSSEEGKEYYELISSKFQNKLLPIGSDVIDITKMLTITVEEDNNKKKQHTLEEITEAYNYLFNVNVSQNEIMASKNSIKSIETCYATSYGIPYNWSATPYMNGFIATNTKINNPILVAFNNLFGTNCIGGTEMNNYWEKLFGTEIKLKFNQFIAEQLKKATVILFDKFNTDVNFEVYSANNNIKDAFECRTKWYKEVTGHVYNSKISYAENIKKLDTSDVLIK
jgi:hypothetical protein